MYNRRGANRFSRRPNFIESKNERYPSLNTFPSFEYDDYEEKIGEIEKNFQKDWIETGYKLNIPKDSFFFRYSDKYDYEDNLKRIETLNENIDAEILPKELIWKEIKNLNMSQDNMNLNAKITTKLNINDIFNNIKDDDTDAESHDDQTKSIDENVDDDDDNDYATTYFNNGEEYIEQEKRVGRGGSSVVYKARYKINNSFVAIKQIEYDKKNVEKLLNEIKILQTLNHENIVTFYQYKIENKKLYLIFEYCKGQNLAYHLKMHTNLSPHYSLRVLQFISNGMKYLRSKNISHFDLKPENILASSLNYPILKITDFGISQYLNEADEISTIRGTVSYMAPELIQFKRLTPKADLWSMGIIFYQSLMGHTPFNSSNSTTILRCIHSLKTIKIPDHLPNNCKILLSLMLQVDVAKRVEFTTFFKEKYLDLEHTPCLQSKKFADNSIAKLNLSTDQNQTNATLYQNVIDAVLHHLSYFDLETTHKIRNSIKIKISSLYFTLVKIEFDLAKEQNSLINLQNFNALFPDNATIQSCNTLIRNCREEFKKGHAAIAINQYTKILDALIKLRKIEDTKYSILFITRHSWDLENVGEIENIMTEAENSKNYLYSPNSNTHLINKKIFEPKLNLNLLVIHTSNNCNIQ
ncbi:Serine/threonine-protein kinase ULK3 [Intoshia linei]|uniref:Serine/threonine-protein kinase ULK3 n=1 Tax=Intoshia linei TaxID=1819745 RepID=A0A177B097_9BILA|nr:Serine/threonine-protein kinase ULK3 [Intoshia linei]